MADRTSARPSDGVRPEPGTFRSLADLIVGLDRLRQLAAQGRGQARVSLAELAKRSGIPRSTVHVYLTGRHPMPADALDAILIALGATGDELREWAEALYRVSTATGHDLSTAEPARAIPRQLPAGTGGFVGRVRELEQLSESLPDRRPDDAAGQLVIVAGPGGVGKSALVVQWARQHLNAFPDGQIWLDLHGFGPGAPLSTIEALGRLLRAIEPTAPQLPGDADIRAEQFRTAAAGRRMLFVLDNVRDSAQVRPLLPGAAEGLVIATSRGDLRALAVTTGANRIVVPRLESSEASSLLSASDVPAEPATIARLVDHCEGLPLAVRIVRERLHGRHHSEADRLLAELDDRRARLDALEIAEAGDDLSMRSILQSSVDVLEPTTARMLALLPLALAPGRTLTRASTEHLAGLDARAVQTALDELVSASLLERGADPDSFIVHDLVAAFAESYLAAVDPAEQRAAQDRLIGYLEAGYAAACEHLRPGFPLLTRAFPHVPVPVTDREEALRWAAQTIDLAAAAIGRAIAGLPMEPSTPAGPGETADGGPADATVWPLLQRVFWATMYRADVTILAPLLAQASERAQRRTEPLLERIFRGQLGIAASSSGDHDTAITALTRAGELAEAVGSFEAVRPSQANLAVALLTAGRPAEAVDRIHAAFGTDEDAYEVGTNTIVTTLADAYVKLGQSDRADALARRCVVTARANGLERAEAMALVTLSEVHRARSEYQLAADQATRAIEIARSLLDDDLLGRSFTARLNALIDEQELVRAGRELPLALSETRSAHTAVMPSTISLQLLRARLVLLEDGPEPALRIAEPALEQARRLSYAWHEAVASLTVTEIEVAAHHRERALVELNRAQQLIDRWSYGSLTVRADAARTALSSGSALASGQ